MSHLIASSEHDLGSLLARDDGGKPAIAINVKEKKLVPGLPDLTSREEVKITAYRGKEGVCREAYPVKRRVEGCDLTIQRLYARLKAVEMAYGKLDY